MAVRRREMVLHISALSEDACVRKILQKCNFFYLGGDLLTAFAV